MDPFLTAEIEQAIVKTGCKPHRMVSGAGHDAMILAEKVPAAMIFLRTPGGISHDPAESVAVEDVEKAIECGIASSRSAGVFARISEKDKPCIISADPKLPATESFAADSRHFCAHHSAGNESVLRHCARQPALGARFTNTPPSLKQAENWAARLRNASFS